MKIVRVADCCYTCAHARDPGYEDQTFVKCVVNDLGGDMEDEVIVRSWYTCDKYKRFKMLELKERIPEPKPKKVGTKRLKNK